MGGFFNAKENVERIALNQHDFALEVTLASIINT